MGKRYPSVFDLAAVELLIEHGGRLPKAALRAVIRDQLPSGTRGPHHTTNACARYLRGEGLIRVDGDDYVAVDLSDLSSWLTRATLERNSHLAQSGGGR